MVMQGAPARGPYFISRLGHPGTVDTLLRCSRSDLLGGVFKRARQISKPCLLGYIGKN
jgi:hypothetical protein